MPLCAITTPCSPVTQPQSAGCIQPTSLSLPSLFAFLCAAGQKKFSTANLLPSSCATSKYQPASQPTIQAGREFLSSAGSTTGRDRSRNTAAHMQDKRALEMMGLADWHWQGVGWMLRRRHHHAPRNRKSNLTCSALLPLLLRPPRSPRWAAFFFLSSPLWLILKGCKHAAPVDLLFIFFPHGLAALRRPGRMWAKAKWQVPKWILPQSIWRGARVFMEYLGSTPGKKIDQKMIENRGETGKAPKVTL